MKICKFCDAENPDSTTICSSCGGNEFKHKCCNCGTIFDEGNFCPKCGVKVGAKAKICPNCGARYFSAACPDCGYIKAGNASAVHVNAAKRSAKKRKNWLWILGWICIFPIPLTILMIRNQKMNKLVKTGIIVIAWILYLGIGVSGNGNRNTHDSETGISQPIISEKDVLADNTEQASNDVTSDSAFAEDAVVNRFIGEFNSNSRYEITGIIKGNIRTKYFGYANGRYLEMINANDAVAGAFCLTINGGQDNATKLSMYEVFRDAIKILDSTIADDDIDAVLAEFDEKDVLVEGYQMGDNITITYVPTKELSYGKSSCRIDISCSNYK